MKFKGLMLLSVLLIAIMTLGAVSASDNVTEDIIPTDDGDVQYEEIPHSLEGDDFPPEIEMTFNYGQNEVVEDGPVYFTATGNDGKMTVSIDGKEKTYECLGGDEVDYGYQVSTKGLPLGEHILNVNIVNDSYYDDVSRNFTFFIKNVVVDVPNPIIIDDYGDYLTVSVGSKDSGKLTVEIDDKTYTYNDISSTLKRHSLINLNASVNPHIIKVTFTTAKGVVYNGTLIINSTSLRLWDKDVIYNKDRKYNFIIPREMDVDKVKVKIDGNQYNFIKGSSIYYDVDVSGLGLGNHSIVVSYDGDDKLAPCSSSARIAVYPKIEFSDDRMTVDKKIVISTEGTYDDYNNFSVYVDGKLYDSILIDQWDVYKIALENLDIGVHKVRVDLTGNHNYTYTKRIHVYVDITGPGLLHVGETGEFIVNFPERGNSDLIAIFGKETVVACFANGTAHVPVPKNMKVGQHDVFFKYYDIDGNLVFNESRSLLIDPVYHVPKTVTNGKDSVYMTLPYDDPNGKFVVEIYNSKDKYSYSVKFKNGKASVPLSKINAGTYTVFPKYFDGKRWALCGTWQMTVKNTKLTASDLSKYYGSSTGFKVKVADYKGKVVKSKYVKFYINGKFVKKVKTTSKGYATLKIAKAPGSYKISAKYGDVQITRKLTVKHAVTLKTAAVKKSAKSLTLKATLKVGKKALKYKKVTFKFNGKTYKAKTNKYGVAKVTIKKTVLKKLKVGKTVKYQATYLKDTVKKSAKVKK